MFNVENIRARPNIIFCDVNLIMSESSFVGRKAPAELTVIDKFKLCKSLTPEKLNRTKIKAVKKKYKKKTFIIIFFVSLKRFLALSGL